MKQPGDPLLEREPSWLEEREGSARVALLSLLWILALQTKGSEQLQLGYAWHSLPTAKWADTSRKKPALV